MVAALLPFLPLLVGGELPVARDHLDHFLSKRWLLAQGLAGEASLLWNPFRAAGTIFLADPQSGVLYPPALLVFGLLRSWSLLGFATTLYLALHGLLGGLGAWAWLRSRGLLRGAAACGAIAFQCSGYTLSLLDLQNNWCSLAWFPLALLGVEKSLRSSGPRWPAFTAFALSLCFLAGEPQVAATCALLVAVRLLLSRRARRRPRAALGRLLLVASLAAALSAAQAVPLLAHARATLRAGGIPPAVAERGSFRAIELLDLFAPSLFEAPGATGLKLSGTQHWIATLYLGWVAIALASWLSRRRALRLSPWAALGALGFLLGMGQGGPGGAWLQEHAGLDWFRYPARFFFLALPAVALATAHGAARLSARVRVSQVPARRAFAPAAAAVLLGLIVAALRPSALGGLAGEAGMAMLRGAALSALVGAWAIAALRSEGRRASVLWAFAFLLVLDLTSRPLAGFQSAEWSRLRESDPPPALAALERDGGPPPRVFGDPELRRARERAGLAGDPERALSKAWRRLSPGALELLGIESLGRDGVYPLRSYEPVLAALRLGHPELDELLGIELRATESGFATREGGPIVSLQRARPGGDSAERIREALRHPESLETEGVPVPEAVAARLPDDCLTEARSELRSWRADELRVEVEAPCAVLLVHWSSLAPGWRAALDGAPVALVPALGAFQAAVVPPGRHELLFAYEPPGLRVAGPVSLLALALGLVLLLRRPLPAGGFTAGRSSGRGDRP